MGGFAQGIKEFLSLITRVCLFDLCDIYNRHEWVSGFAIGRHRHGETPQNVYSYLLKGRAVR
jgi:hypothetical protein